MEYGNMCERRSPSLIMCRYWARERVFLCALQNSGTCFHFFYFFKSMLKEHLGCQVKHSKSLEIVMQRLIEKVLGISSAPLSNVTISPISPTSMQI